MFGYVRIWKPELKMREFDWYQGVYCSLCRQLGRRYGFVARMTLSYDFTFLALFSMALSDRCVGFQKGRCPFNPLKKRLCCCDAAENESLAFAADTAMLLTHQKFLDAVSDERGAKRLAARLGAALTKRAYRKASRLRPQEAAAVEQYMREQQALEAARTASVDAAAQPTAALLSALATATLPADMPRKDAARFGYMLGRFIYLADAADDLEEDCRHGSYNPYVLCKQLPRDADEAALACVRAYAAQSLHACVGACVECYERLPIKRFDGILQNVLFDGLPAVIAQIEQGKRKG